MPKLFAILSAALFSLSLEALAEEHRQLGAHEHGHGALNIAIEGKSVTMELDAPGADIAGFEHEATTPEQKAVLEKANAQLAKPLDLFKLPASANCTVKDAKVAIKTEAHDDDGDDDHDKASAKDAGHEAGHEDHEHHHSAYHATYSLECAAPDKLNTIDFSYFNTFSGARALTVNVISSKAQSSFEVSRDKPHLDLSALI